MMTLELHDTKWASQVRLTRLRQAGVSRPEDAPDRSQPFCLVMMLDAAMHDQASLR
jgi:hypothetical protein